MAHTALVLLLQLVAGALGWWWQSWPGAFAGAVLAGGGAALWQAVQGNRFLRWIKEPQGGAPRGLSGQWGDAGYRTARALRAEQDATRVADVRLQSFLSAIQASPNGVVVLGPDGRIQWFNEMASAHFGFVPQRDLLQHIGNLVRDPAFTAYFAAGAFLRWLRLMVTKHHPSNETWGRSGRPRRALFARRQAMVCAGVQGPVCEGRCTICRTQCVASLRLLHDLGFSRK